MYPTRYNLFIASQPKVSIKCFVVALHWPCLVFLIVACPVQHDKYIFNDVDNPLHLSPVLIRAWFAMWISAELHDNYATGSLCNQFETFFYKSGKCKAWTCSGNSEITDFKGWSLQVILLQFENYVPSDSLNSPLLTVFSHVFFLCSYDFAFVDAEKKMNQEYFELLLQLVGQK